MDLTIILLSENYSNFWGKFFIEVNSEEMASVEEKDDLYTSMNDQGDAGSTSSDDAAAIRPVSGPTNTTKQKAGYTKNDNISQRNRLDDENVDMKTLSVFYRTASDEIGKLAAHSNRVDNTLNDILRKLNSMDVKNGSAPAAPFRGQAGDSRDASIRDSGYMDQPGAADFDSAFSVRREEAKRRSSIFGRGADGMPDLEPTHYREALHEIRTTSLMRAKDVRMKRLETLGDIEATVTFLDSYNELVKKHSGKHEFTLLDFSSREVVLQMVAHAGRMRDIRLSAPASFSGGLYLESDKTIREIILDRVKARSFEDFTRKIKLAKFPPMESSEVSAGNFEEFYNNALLYTHNFTMYVNMISHRANGMDILPLYKDGEQLGVVNYYLKGFPRRMGTNLFAKACNGNPGLRRMSSLPEFTQAFMGYLGRFVELDQQVQDLSDTLTRKDRDDEDQNNRRKEYHAGDHARGRHFETRDPDRGTSHHLSTSEGSVGRDTRSDEYTAVTRERGCDCDPNEDWCRGKDEMSEGGSETRDEDSDYDSQGEPSERGELKAFPDKPVSQDARKLPEKERSLKGCYVKFQVGECPKKECQFDHSDAGMLECMRRKLSDVVNSKHSPSKEYVFKALEREYENKTKGPLGAKTGLRPSTDKRY